MSLVDAVADTVEEEVRWWLDNRRQDSGSAGGVSPHRAHCETRSCHVLRGFRWLIYNSAFELSVDVGSGFIVNTVRSGEFDIHGLFSNSCRNVFSRSSSPETK